MTEQPVKQRPAHYVRIGTVKAAVWQNFGASGTWYAVTFERIYKDGDDWKTSASFGKDELLALAKAADLAHTWVIEQETPPQS